ncbi:PRD domain-containing protein [Yersinia nurmii]|uniref:PRD domain-containing protein n=1 Tax=Yersinia nurmii TaxID=685706 RepID=A0AAW7JZ73_9GAMM|nr:PRD domain-containing protein [Yersinia nurmii]MDN0087573.1 PRD domain-containing protein [Yersinia nurmii]CNF17456.1 protein containing PTS-regulatory domain [Yersinia nurmii]
MDPRLSILYQAGVIDEEVFLGMNKVINRLANFWQISVDNVQGEMAVTHMANALMRTRRGELIKGMDADLLSEIIQSEDIQYIRDINQDLLAYFDIKPDDNEQGYLLSNLYSLYLASNLPPLR